MPRQNALDEILDKVDEMPLEEQGILADLIKNRYNEKRREEILKNLKKTRREQAKGQTSKGTASELMNELGEC
jgi:hypothetical protein